MKTTKTLLALLAIAAMFAACTKEASKGTEEGGDSKQEDPVVELSKACRLTKVTVTSGASSRECTIYEKDKSVDVLNIAGYDMTALSFEIEISEKATTTFDQTKTYDCSDTLKPVTIRVVAEDSTVFQDYTFDVRVPELAFECKPVWDKKAGTLGMKGSNSFINASIAFVDLDKIASAEGIVFDYSGNKVGDINMDGVCNTTLMNIANDVNGILIGSATAEDNTYGEFYAWLDGYDKAPAIIYSNKADAGGVVNKYMSCGGDVKGDFILTAITDGRGATTIHHCFEFHNGDYENPEWHAFETDLISNDGNWGQMVSPTSGNIDGWFVIGDSNGSNMGYWVYTRQGIENNFDDNELWGTTWPDGLIPDGTGGVENHWYGNYSTGHVRGFQFKGIDYAICTTTGWPCTYITIQSMVPEYETIVDEDGEEEEVVKESHYLLRTQQLDGGQVVPSASYIYNEDEDAGYVVLSSSTHVYLYKITGEIL